MNILYVVNFVYECSFCHCYFVYRRSFCRCYFVYKCSTNFVYRTRCFIVYRVFIWPLLFCIQRVFILTTSLCYNKWQKEHLCTDKMFILSLLFCVQNNNECSSDKMNTCCILSLLFCTQNVHFVVNNVILCTECSFCCYFVQSEHFVHKITECSFCLLFCVHKIIECSFCLLFCVQSVHSVVILTTCSKRTLLFCTECSFCRCYTCVQSATTKFCRCYFVYRVFFLPLLFCVQSVHSV